MKDSNFFSEAENPYRGITREIRASSVVAFVLSILLPSSVDGIAHVLHVPMKVVCCSRHAMLQRDIDDMSIFFFSGENHAENIAHVPV